VRMLVTGAGGFAGRHLVTHLLGQGHEVVASGLDFPEPLPAEAERLTLDVTDGQACWNALTDTRPDGVFHLAAVASVHRAERDPGACYAVNLGGTRNMLDACVDGHANVRFLLVSSAEVYGGAPPEAMPLGEDHPLRPGTVYAATKACAEMAVHHAVARGLHAVVARAFNHIGPGQSRDFVTAAFAHQVARIEASLQDALEVGNLGAVRDFSDVRDTVDGYLRCLEHGRPGDVFNVTSGAAVRVGDIVETLSELARRPIEVREDPARLRPLDVPIFHGSGERLRERCGFAPRFDLRRTLAEILDYWRDFVARESGESPTPAR